MLEKAVIINIDTGAEVRCMFNPKEYTFTKQNKWTEKTAKGAAVPHLEYEGGAPASLKLQLLFDTLEAHGKDQAGGDVRNSTKDLWDMMKVSEAQQNDKTGKGAPPHVRFKWGTVWAFEAVIESLSQRFILFAPDGTPLRALVDISLKQIRDEGQYPRQNPSSGSVAGERIYLVRAGDTLAGIAAALYGDPTVWRHLADHNGLSDPRRLRPGQVLMVRPLPTFANSGNDL
ncbi:MAG: LysM peptidoglycan-binding domain-containing protein [Chloroflexi bacterium]|nr:LysM peptidoglycan-binding domain-containing protein [Chloroflexota bacterium]